jgi:tetratricopeptide (TPR) repeat protein
MNREMDQIRHAQRWTAEHAGERIEFAQMCIEFAQMCNEFAACEEGLLRLVLDRSEYVRWLQDSLEARKKYNRGLSDVSVSASAGPAYLATVGVETVGIEDEANQLNILGWAHLDACEYEAALSCFEQALRINLQGRAALGDGSIVMNRDAIRSESIAACLINLGTVYGCLRRFEEAIESLKEGLSIAKKHRNRREIGRALGNLGTVYADLGRASEAKRAAKKSLVIARKLGERRGEADQLANLGTLYSDARQYGKAVRSFVQALTINTELENTERAARNIADLGIVYSRAGLYDNATLYLEEAIQQMAAMDLDEWVERLGQEVKRVHHLWSLEISEWQDAFSGSQGTRGEDSDEKRLDEKRFRETLRVLPKNLSLVSGYAQWLDLSDENKKAVRLIRPFLAKPPYSIQLVCQFAWALVCSRGNLARAERWLDTADKLNPGNREVGAGIADTRAWMAYRQGRYQRALDILEPVLSLSRRLPELSYHAGVINHRLGNWHAAMTYLEAAVKSEQVFGRRAEAVRLLQELRGTESRSW